MVGIMSPEGMNMYIHKTRYQEIPVQVQNFLSLPGRQEFSGFHDHTALQAEMQAFLEFYAVKYNSVDNQHTFSFPLSPSALSQRASGPARAPQETEASCLSPDKARGHVPLPAGKP